MAERLIHSHTAVFLLMLAAAKVAHAGVVTDGVWAPTGCGVKPTAPALNLKDPDAFNRSIDGVNSYRKNINVYLDCLVKEANADIQVVNQSAKAAQLAAREADDKILADVKAANEKFK